MDRAGEGPERSRGAALRARARARARPSGGQSGLDRQPQGCSRARRERPGHFGHRAGCAAAGARRRMAAREAGKLGRRGGARRAAGAIRARGAAVRAGDAAAHRAAAGIGAAPRLLRKRRRWRESSWCGAGSPRSACCTRALRFAPRTASRPGRRSRRWRGSPRLDRWPPARAGGTLLSGCWRSGARCPTSAMPSWRRCSSNRSATQRVIASLSRR